MTTLIVGASGATGRLLVQELLNCGESVRVIVRVNSNLSEPFTYNHKNLFIIHASILELNDTEIAQHVKGCSAVASCLGHNMSFKGIYGHPRRLVMDATSRLCNAIRANQPSTCPMESPKLTIQ
jgi:putative NADH-flavin reductase